MLHDENIAPIPTRDKTITDVAIIINWTFPIATEVSVKANVAEIITIASLTLGFVLSLTDLIARPAGQK